MGKIYDGENKLNVVQVCAKLAEAINPEQANVLMVRGDGSSNIVNPKTRFAHMVLDAYKHLPSTTEEDTLVKKLCKHLMEKYMKSVSTMDSEDKAYDNLLKTIAEKAKEME